nr:DUF2188 domain-containing protein [uncultured Cupriavidus sp.]
MSCNNIHVVAAADQWAVVADGGHGREVFRSLEEAITSGTAKARQRQVELLIHGRDGHVRARSDYRDDPCNVSLWRRMA